MVVGVNVSNCFCYLGYPGLNGHKKVVVVLVLETLVLVLSVYSDLLLNTVLHIQTNIEKIQM